jgi:hypothetical protein
MLFKILSFFEKNFEISKLGTLFWPVFSRKKWFNSLESTNEHLQWFSRFCRFRKISKFRKKLNTLLFETSLIEKMIQQFRIVWWTPSMLFKIFVVFFEKYQVFGKKTFQRFVESSILLVFRQIQLFLWNVSLVASNKISVTYNLH